MSQIEHSGPVDVRVVYDGDGWTLHWTDDDGQRHSRRLHGNRTVEDAVQDAVEYFHGLVKIEDISHDN